ncbi:hypothetical protein C8F01DRAFT_1377779 [Mycena amicta]|nr:hypothetical protein C8F01DRAFT_1377779 [Mycena amicta]
MPGTPASQRTTRNSNKSQNQPPEPTSTPRRCTTCKRPRKGHPRSGCPFGEAEDAEKSPGVTEKLSALDLSAVDSDDTDTDNTEKEDTEKEKETKAKARVAMPGTLGPMPTWILSQSSKGWGESFKEEALPKEDSSSLSSIAVAPASSQRSDSDATDVPRPLTRTPSVVEREVFTTSLASLAKAAVYVLPTQDVPVASHEALARGLFVRRLSLDHVDSLLFVGQTDAAVAVLENQVQNKMHSLVPKNADKGPGTLAKASKGLVVGAVGAVAAWGALAFA